MFSAKWEHCNRSRHVEHLRADSAPDQCTVVQDLCGDVELVYGISEVRHEEQITCILQAVGEPIGGEQQ